MAKGPRHTAESATVSKVIAFAALLMYAGWPVQRHPQAHDASLQIDKAFSFVGMGFACRELKRQKDAGVHRCIQI